VSAKYLKIEVDLRNIQALPGHKSREMKND